MNRDGSMQGAYVTFNTENRTYNYEIRHTLDRKSKRHLVDFLTSIINRENPSIQTYIIYPSSLHKTLLPLYTFPHTQTHSLCINFPHRRNMNTLCVQIKHKNDVRVKTNCKIYKERAFQVIGTITLDYYVITRDYYNESKVKKQIF